MLISYPPRRVGGKPETAQAATQKMKQFKHSSKTLELPKIRATIRS